MTHTPELTAMPGTFTAGTTLTYRKSDSDHRAGDGWGLSVTVAGPSTKKVIAANDADDFIVTFTASETAALSPGTYYWTERAEHEDHGVFEVGCGTVIVKPDIAAATGGSLELWEEKMLKVVEQVLEGRIPADVENYQIAGRAVNRHSIEFLTNYRDRLIAKIRRIRNGGRLGRPVLAKFTGTGFNR